MDFNITTKQVDDDEDSQFGSIIINNMSIVIVVDVIAIIFDASIALAIDVQHSTSQRWTMRQINKISFDLSHLIYLGPQKSPFQDIKVELVMVSGK